MPENNDWSDLEPQTIFVDDETWEWLTRRLDEPPQVIPSIRRLYERYSLTEPEEEQ